MTRSIVIIYFSEADTTHQVAESICAGVAHVNELRSCDFECHLLRITSEQIIGGRFSETGYLKLIDDADAVIFGSPTYMGGPAAQFKAFADESSSRWDEQRWDSKVAAGFTVGSNPGGDQLSTLQYLSVLAAQHGMLWVNLTMPLDHEGNTENKLGAQLGFAGTVPGDTISAADVKAAKQLGARVTQLCHRLASCGNMVD